MADKLLGESTKVIFEAQHDYRYRADVHTRMVRWSNGNAPLARRAYPISDHLRQADRLVVYEHPFYVELARAVGKPYVFHGLGTVSAEHAEQVLQMCGEDGAKAYCDTHELAVLGYEWLGSPVFQKAFPPLEAHLGYRVAHAPSNRVVKGTSRVVAACQTAGVELDLIENVSFTACLYRKALCDVLIDQVRGGEGQPEHRLSGYGVNGLEAMAMGQPVIGWASREVYDEQTRYGPLPYLWSDTGLIEDILSLKDPSKREQQVTVAREYLKEHHDPWTQGLRVIEACS